MMPLPNLFEPLVRIGLQIYFYLLLITYIGCLILYLPAYSPDLNPIEESFSTCKSYIII